ncbi:MAG: hypothetical protein ACOCWB_02355 [Bacteroidota bacterium]
MKEKINKEHYYINKTRIAEIKNNETLFRKVIRIAQYESELDLGVNPLNFEQANVGNLTEKDFGYIRKVCDLVEKRFQNPHWLTKTLDAIEKKYEEKRYIRRGIRFDDELFKTGRGILESFLKEKYDERN